MAGDEHRPRSSAVHRVELQFGLGTGAAAGSQAPADASGPARNWSRRFAPASWWSPGRWTPCSPAGWLSSMATKPRYMPVNEDVAATCRALESFLCGAAQLRAPGHRLQQSVGGATRLRRRVPVPEGLRMSEIFPATVYILCFLTSAACAWLLGPKLSRSSPPGSCCGAASASCSWRSTIWRWCSTS